MLRGTLVALAALASGTVSAFSATTIPTPQLPVAIFPHGDRIHILTNRSDSDYDGTQDDGEVPAHWIVVNRTTYAVLQTMEFPWADVRTERAAFAADANELYITVDNNVWAYDAATLTAKNIVHNEPAAAISCNATGTERYYSIRSTDFVSPGKLVLDIQGSPQKYELEAGINNQQSIPFRDGANYGVVAINEGNFGAEDGTVDIWVSESFSFNKTTLTVGGIPNHITLAGNIAYVTCNTSHWIVAIDVLQKKAIDTIYVQTTGFEGPRESVVSGGKIFTTTWEPDVRIFDIATGEQTGRITNAVRAEGLAMVDGKLWVTRKYEDDDAYTPASGVDVFELNDATSVSENVVSVPALHVVRTGTSLQVTTVRNDAPVTMVSLDGRTTSVAATPGTTTISVQGFASGMYIVSHAGRSTTVVLQ